MAPLEGISQFTGLHLRLTSDLRFRYQYGFPIDRPVPSIATLSRVFVQIVTKNLAEKRFYDLVMQCRAEEIITGTTIAIDSTAIDAYERKQPKSRCQETGNAPGEPSLTPLGIKSHHPMEHLAAAWDMTWCTEGRMDAI